jgi:hypothetical protein
VFSSNPFVVPIYCTHVEYKIVLRIGAGVAASRELLHHTMILQAIQTIQPQRMAGDHNNEHADQQDETLRHFAMHSQPQDAH